MDCAPATALIVIHLSLRAPLRPVDGNLNVSNSRVILYEIHGSYDRYSIDVFYSFASLVLRAKGI